MSDTRLGPSAGSGGTARGVGAPGRPQIGEGTLRVDRWWVQPATTFTLLVIWLLYALVRTASQRFYFVEEYHYLSPFFSPCVSESCIPASRDFGTWFGEFPPFVPFANVFSIGDVLISIGIAVLIASAMRDGARGHLPTKYPSPGTTES